MDTTDALTFDELAMLDGMAAEAITPIAPPPEVRARLMDVIRRTPQLDDSIPGEHESRTIRANEGRWFPIGRGAQTKKLSFNAERDTVTFLLEMEPHAIVPAHDHKGSEDTYVVRGSCSIGAVGLAMGDFHHVDAGAHHGDVVASPEGCTLIITIDAADAAA